MIATITPNPAIDQFYWVDQVNEPETALLTRANQTLTNAGGKGINVSVLLHHLGLDTVCMGFIAGSMGHTIEHFLHAQKITTNFVWTDGESRTNSIVIVKGKEVHPLEVNASGPIISESAQSRFSKRFKNMLNRCNEIMLGGSLPPGLGNDYYKNLIKQAQDRNIPAILYASGEIFNEACDAGAWIVKPDVRERSEVLGKSVISREEVYAVGRELLQADNKIVIMAHEVNHPVASQMVLTQDEVFDFRAQDAAVCNRVGAGDAFLAGLLFKLKRGRSLLEAGRFGMAASIACTEAQTTMPSNRSAIEHAQQRVQEERL